MKIIPLIWPTPLSFVNRSIGKHISFKSEFKSPIISSSFTFSSFFDSFSVNDKLPTVTKSPSSDTTLNCNELDNTFLIGYIYP